jgi:RimJ/RimL family protein N-acetyltransferase
MTISITTATEDHAEAVLKYYTALLSENLAYILNNPAPTLEQERDFIRKHDGERSALFIATDGDNVVGISNFSIPGHHQYSHTCSLGISVARDFRRRGIGSDLIYAGEDWGRSRGVRRISFDMLDGNPALAFYQHLGFEVEGRKREAIKVDDEFRDLLLLGKILA